MNCQILDSEQVEEVKDYMSVHHDVRFVELSGNRFQFENGISVEFDFEFDAGDVYKNGEWLADIFL